MIRKVLQVGYLNPLMNYGGVERYIDNLSQMLNGSYGVSVDVLCADNFDKIQGVRTGKIISLNTPFFKKRGLSSLSKYLYGRRVRNFLNVHGTEYDVLHFHGDNGIIGREFSERTLLTLHGVAKNSSSFKNRVLSYFPSRIEKNNVENAKIVYSISDEASRFFGRYRSDIRMIKQSIDTSLYHAPTEPERKNAREKLGIDEDSIVGIIIGRDPKRKGLEIAISAVNAIDDPRIRLVAIGFPQVERANSRVRFTGDIDEDTKILYLTASDFFIFPSMKEGFPISVLEAAACGLPLIVSMQSGVSELKNIVPFFKEIDSFSPSDYGTALRDYISLRSKSDFVRASGNVNGIGQYSTINSAQIYMDAYRSLK